ncbi:MAG: 5'-nucleotidase C-terminal domain-containing protein [Candidatus Synoicihabitans palmerolidicus]|nr:5'-nucleotidase C-terminal domain-containing protein [Candidatus Synoicihabitans palmerolidicus]
MEPDPKIIALTQEVHDATHAWFAEPIGHLDQEINARLEDTAIIDLIHRVQLTAGETDVSLAASFNSAARLPAGDLTVRDIAGLYVYDNTLVVLELTGAQLKQTLEHAAGYFLPGKFGRSAVDHVDPSVPGYSFDMADGIEDTIDLGRRPGERIVALRFRGRALDPDRKLRVATHNYRANGGGATPC